MHVSATCAACVQHDPEDQLNYACVQQGLKLSNHPVTDTRVCRSIQHVTICSKATTIRIRSRAGLFPQVTCFRHQWKHPARLASGPGSQHKLCIACQ